MKCLPIIFILFAFIFTGILVASDKLPYEKKNGEQEIETRSVENFQLIQRLTKGHSKVLIQSDAFVFALKQAYVAGEGLILKDIHRIFDALAFAAQKHQFQCRKDHEQTPYIIHPIGVAYNLISIGYVRDPDILIAALLHDTVEDTPTTFDEIEQMFGLRVALFIREVTDDKSLPKHVRKQLQIDDAPGKSGGAAQIKLADKLYNLNDLSNAAPLDWDEERMDAYFRWAKAVVDNLPWVNSFLKKAVDEIIENYWLNKK